MTTTMAYRWTAGAGVSASALLLITSPLYIRMGTPPSLADEAAFAAYLGRNRDLAVTTKLVDALYIAGLLVFLAGLCHLLRRARPDDDWLATLSFAAGLVMATVILVGDILAGGAALDTYTAPDPAVVRGLSEAALPAFGAIGFMLTALFLVAVGAAIRATRLLPHWASSLAFIIALLNSAAVPTIYGGNDFLAVVIAGGAASAGFYSYSSMIAGLAFVVWLLLVSVALVRKRDVTMAEQRNVPRRATASGVRERSIR